MNFYKNSVNSVAVFLVAIAVSMQACSPNNVTIENGFKKAL